MLVFVQRERERDRQTDIDRHRQRYTDIQRQRYRQTERESGSETLDKDREPNRQRRQMDRNGRKDTKAAKRYR